MGLKTIPSAPTTPKVLVSNVMLPVTLGLLGIFCKYVLKKLDISYLPAADADPPPRLTRISQDQSIPVNVDCALLGPCAQHGRWLLLLWGRSARVRTLRGARGRGRAGPGTKPARATERGFTRSAQTVDAECGTRPFSPLYLRSSIEAPLPVASVNPRWPYCWQ